jgi:23S rRNA pseudouridine2605 synthase
MFQEIGHHVEKIRRVRYGPLELDVEPGKLRHLTVKEVAQLKAAVGPAARPTVNPALAKGRLERGTRH